MNGESGIGSDTRGVEGGSGADDNKRYVDGDSGRRFEAAPLKGFYAYKNTFDDDSVWLDVPKQVTFINNNDPYSDHLSPDPADSIVSAPQMVQGSRKRQHVDLSSVDDNFNGIQAVRADIQPSGLHALSAAASRDYHQSSQTLSNSNTLQPPLPFPSMRDTSLMPSVDSTSQNIRMHTTTARSIAPPNTNINHSLHPAVLSSPSLPMPIQSQLSTGMNDQHQAIVYSSHPLDIRSPIEDLMHAPTVETDHEIAFLLRYFSEVPGQWMDLFDKGCYFAKIVPNKALTNPLLKYAAVAYAAKQLGRVHGVRSTVGGPCKRLARMEQYPDSDKVDWYYKAAEYNNKAIALLMASLLEGNRSGSLIADEVSGDLAHAGTAAVGGEVRRRNGREQAELNGDAERGKRCRPLGLHTPPSSDECLAATVILSVSEFLDHHGFAWSRHLNGTRTLLDIAETGMTMPSHPPQFGTTQVYGGVLPRLSLSKARRATFWNFARQDFLAAFINESQTRTDTGNLALWKAAGLLLDEEGFLQPSNVAKSGCSEDDEAMHEDMIGNGLIWLMSKLLNFLAAGSGSRTGYVSHLAKHPREQLKASSVDNAEVLQKWKQIEKEIEVWHSRLPHTFRPCARLESSQNEYDRGDEISKAGFSEIWYSIPLCASAMQSYHMARILLLINKPRQQPVEGDGSVNNGAIETEIRHHSYEICGIALSRPEASVRIHQLQPLYVAGLQFKEKRERRVVLDLLRAIETDLGWATEYRIKQLLQQWGLDEDSAVSFSNG
ncbi:MAG: hypothetical protein M1825_006355 [Sarcosagium campestre]|nr:MAG: hypothetical protein M1825_006355 [Sarcosagium campestre]